MIENKTQNETGVQKATQRKSTARRNKKSQFNFDDDANVVVVDLGV